MGLAKIQVFLSHRSTYLRWFLLLARLLLLVIFLPIRTAKKEVGLQFEGSEGEFVTKEKDFMPVQTFSYLDRPRLHFSGRFRADTATINNLIQNFDVKSFSPNWQSAFIRGGYNPFGTNTFGFHECKVTAYCRHQRDALCRKADPTVKVGVYSAFSRTSAKMVDLDPQNQKVPQIFGLQISVGECELGTPAVIGDFRPAALVDTWAMTAGFPGKSEGRLAGRYQSKLENVKWDMKQLSKYPALAELEQVSPTVLSISFVLYAYGDCGEGNVTYGRLFGAIGPGTISGPNNYVRGRFLQALSGVKYLNTAQFTFNGVLTIDFGYAIGRRKNGCDFSYNFNQIGRKLCVMLVESKHLIGFINLSDPDVDRAFGGIVEFRPDPAVWNYNDRIAVTNCVNESNFLMLETDTFVRPMHNHVRWMNPGEEWNVSLLVLSSGRPKGGYMTVIDIHLANQPIFLHTSRQSDSTKNALTFSPSGDQSLIAYSDSDGIINFTLRAGDPGNARKIIDGSLFDILCLPFERNSDDKKLSLSVRVFDKYTWGDKPTWHGNVKDIFRQYDNLYPVMRQVLVLGDYNSVVKPRNLQYLNFSLQLPFEDPGYMPATRDLSAAKRAMVLNWLNQPYPPLKGVPKRLSLNELKAKLQLALQVEHATIPMYLYAMYSIKPGCNKQAREIIHDIVVEEMVHVGLVANILLALGGQPIFTKSDFIPSYPGALPGGLRPDVVLRLSSFSKWLVRDIFMEVEAPEYLTDDEEEDGGKFNNTIGGFYKTIRINMKYLETMARQKNRTIFTGCKEDQVSYDLPGHLRIFPVDNIHAAVRAIRTIVAQGEGNSQLNPLNNQGALSHYYRFGEIYHERKLIQNSTEEWVYEGSAIPFDATGVWPVPDNPRLEDYSEGSSARQLAYDFSRRYFSVLSGLERLFTGSPGEVHSVISNMFLMTMNAAEIVALPVDGNSTLATAGAHVGPLFENPLDLAFTTGNLQCVTLN